MRELENKSPFFPLFEQALHCSFSEEKLCSEDNCLGSKNKRGQCVKECFTTSRVTVPDKIFCKDVDGKSRKSVFLTIKMSLVRQLNGISMAGKKNYPHM
ncbi:hypothetical protein DW103_04975 [Parabacteroides sp. AM08-6]|nr:hypothetical protein DW103_04975 [Parabacteroides sp. AM08-6]